MNMQSFFSQTPGAANQHTDQQPRNFTAHSSPYDGSQYGYMSIAGSYPIDHTLVVHHESTVPSNVGSTVEVQTENIELDIPGPNTSPSTRVHNDHDGISAESSKPGQSQDEEQDVSAGQKRKRSKVSRACDQCRKKKIRCDVDAADDGVLKTCNNCQTRGQICEFSRIPQKRGPSKGYIKELSERVQHVEGQLALQNTPGFRTSIDGAGTFGDATLSPEDDLSYRRQSSMSHYKSPFASISRDRMPSVGGWHASTIHSPLERGRFSIAIPPDQQLPAEPLSTAKPATPSWTSWLDAPPRRAEKQYRLNSPDATALCDASELRSVFELVQPVDWKDLMLLPDTVEKLDEITQPARQELRMILVSTMKLFAMEYIPYPDQHDASSSFNSVELRDAVDDALLEQWRSVDGCVGANALTLLWATLLYSITAQHYFELRLRSSEPHPSYAIGVALRLCTDAFQRRLRTEPGDLDVYWHRAMYYTVILARLEALSYGLEDEPLPTILLKRLHDTNVPSPTSPGIRFLALSMEACQATLSLIDEQGTVSRTSLTRLARLHNSSILAWQTLCALDNSAVVVQLVRQFFDLLCLRVSHFHVTRSVIEPLLAMIDVLDATLTLQTGQSVVPKYNPLTRHLYTLAVFTLTEVMGSDLVHADAEVLERVNRGREKLEVSLASWANYHSRVRDRASFQSDVHPIYWADALTALLSRQAEARINGAPSYTSEEQVTSSLVALLQQGYMKVCNAFMLSTLRRA